MINSIESKKKIKLILKLMFFEINISTLIVIEYDQLITIYIKSDQWNFEIVFKDSFAMDRLVRFNICII